ncbi:MAG TPA: N-acetylglucosamine-6-phosphate deacetylase [Flavisolibacter sp.]|nr:N-acetylglucosamine-6-phosphate deacetylase [Flavisolibacter sp.]
MPRIYIADKVFTGTEWLKDYAVVIEDERILNVLPSTGINGNVKRYENAFIAPAFIDAQVYGAAQKLFSFFPTKETLQIMYDTFIKEGTALFQPTLATNTIDVFKKAIDAVRDYRSSGWKGVHGLHLEGPWLNKLKRGAHMESLIHSPTIAEVRDLLDYGSGVISMITIAPEVCSKEVIELILSHNIIISAGHSSATYKEAIDGFNLGISTVTHLFNAMSPFSHRAPGLAGATMNHPTVLASIIPDGYHVDFEAVAIAKKIMGERLFAITDAVTETADGPYQHHLAGEKYESSGILSGSVLSMHKAFKNLVTKVGVETEEALRMCSLYPAIALKSDHLYGKIAPGYSGQLIVPGNELELIDVIS